VFDAEARLSFVHTADGLREVKDPILRTSRPEIVLPIAEIFESLDPASEPDPEESK
jgi:hypothetical protein